jgi:hypothetical protein
MVTARQPRSHTHALDAEHFEQAQNAPERKLLAAMIRRALLDLLDTRTSPDAALWIRSNRRGEFSFRWVCEHLDFEPDKLRTAMLDYYQQLLIKGENDEESIKIRAARFMC